MPFVSLTISSHYMQLWFTFCETYVYVSVNSFFSCGCSVYSFSFYGNLGTLPWCFEKTADCHICIETFNKGSVFFFYKNSKNSGWFFYLLCSNIEVLVKGNMCNAQYKYFYAKHFHISSFLEMFFLSIFGNFLFGIFDWFFVV